MKAIQRLNEWIGQVPEKYRGQTAAKAVVALKGLTGKVAPGMERMMAAASTMGKVRVAYEIPGELATELFDIPFENYSQIDAGMIHFPHESIFVYAPSNEPGVAWEFFIHEETYFDGRGPSTGIFFADWDVSTMLTLFQGQTVGESLENCFAPLKAQYEATSSDKFPRKVEEAMQFIVKLALFLTSTNDYQDIPVLPIPGGKRNRNKPDFLKEAGINRVVGGRFVGALRLWRKEGGSHDPQPTGRTVRPHLRAGHFQLFWTGKGRTIPKVQFVHPCLVNADEIGDAEIHRTVKI